MLFQWSCSFSSAVVYQVHMGVMVNLSTINWQAASLYLNMLHLFFYHFFNCLFIFRLLWMVCGKYVLKLVDHFSSQDLMVIILFYWLFFLLNLVMCISALIKIWKMFLLLGELLCPAYHELCSTSLVPGTGQCPKSCNFNGDCVEGRCHCFLGFHGSECSKRELLISSLPFFIISTWDATLYEVRFWIYDLCRHLPKQL